MKNEVFFAQTEHVKTVQSAYSDDVYERVPFTCDPSLKDDELYNRLAKVVHAKYKPSHHGGCGYSCTLTQVERTLPFAGYIHLMHYHGIGD